MEKRAKQGKSAAALERCPDIFEDLIDVWKAFTDLSKGRQCGFGISPIATIEILAWLDIHQIEPCERVEYHDYIRALDSHLMANETKKEK